MKSIIDVITARDYLLQLVDSIAGLFIAKFDPVNPLSISALLEREAGILKKVSSVSKEEARIVLLKMLEGTVQHIFLGHSLPPSIAPSHCADCYFFCSCQGSGAHEFVQR